VNSAFTNARAPRLLILPLALGLAAAGLLLISVRAARADMAPFPAQEGNTFGPAAATNIQMISETVLIQLTDLTDTVLETGYPHLGAKVTADFTMRNPDNKPQLLGVGFPLQVPKQAIDAGSYVKIKNLAAFVGGSAIETQLATVGSETWSAWQMTFAPGDTFVRVTYDLPATTDACNAELGYVIHTGAAWAGPIGQADLIVRYPYAAEATFVSPKGIYLGDSTAGYHVEGSDLHWHYENLEPTAANDLAVTFVAPECWLKVAAARAALNQHGTADNYWHLATAYADIVFPHHGFNSPLIAQVADAQYQKALALDPQNPQINAEYAEFLIEQVGVGQLLPTSHQPDRIQQCTMALMLAPSDEILLPLCGYFLSSQIGDPNISVEIKSTAATVLTAVAQLTFPPNAIDTPTPSAAASPSPRPTASATARATQTALPQPSLTSSPQPAATPTPVAVAQITTVASQTLVPTPPNEPGAMSPSAMGLIGVVVVLLLAGGVYYWRRHSRR
jgi:hypothetical protein